MSEQRKLKSCSKITTNYQSFHLFCFLFFFGFVLSSFFPILDVSSPDYAAIGPFIGLSVRLSNHVRFCILASLNQSFTLPLHPSIRPSARPYIRPSFPQFLSMCDSGNYRYQIKQCADDASECQIGFFFRFFFSFLFCFFLFFRFCFCFCFFFVCLFFFLFFLFFLSDGPFFLWF